MTKAEYEQAVLRIDELITAYPDTMPEELEDELQSLADQVWEYEEKYYPVLDNDHDC